MTSNRLRTVLVVLLLAATATVASDMRTEMAIRDSLSRVHPRMRASWLRERGLDDSPYTTFRKPDSGSGLRCIGRWPWGPSWELCGRDSLLFLGSGSGVRILSISDSIHPRMLGQIAARGLVSQLVIRDTLLFVACGNWGAQVYSISDPANPLELGSMDAVIYDLAVIDTFCYTLGVPSGSSGSDSLRIYSLADPIQPRQLGAVRDSGHTLAVVDGHAYSAGRWTLNVYDVTNPAAPQWVSSLGGSSLALCARGNLLFRSGVSPSYFSVYDITDPLNISEVGQLSGYGGHALYVDDYFAYLSCGYDHEGIFVIDVTNPSNPQMRGSYNPEGTENYDPYIPTPLSYGYLASDYGGLMVIDLHNVNTPTEAWSGYKAASAVNASVDGSRAYIADGSAGLHILDVAEPTLPVELGQYDSIGSADVRSATGRDSFAYIGRSGSIQRQLFRVLDVSDPTQPTLVATESCFNTPEDMVLRDSFIYAAEANRFQIFNVARPREPVLVGSCAGDGVAVVVQDSFAYTAAGATRITNIARPDNPFVVSTILGHSGSGIAVRDTFLYIPAAYDTLWVYGTAHPTSPNLVGFAPVGAHTSDIALAESTAVVATVDGLVLFSLQNPAQPRRVGSITTPYGLRRVVYSAPYWYVAMWDAGVGVYKSESVGIAEERRERTGSTGLAATPNPTRNAVVLQLPEGASGSVLVRDVTGRCVSAAAPVAGTHQLRLDLGRLPAGVYFVEVRRVKGCVSVKVVRN